MRSFSFTIRGNQKDDTGNPIPYKRTLGGVYSKTSKDYFEWKDYVRSEFDRDCKSQYTVESMPYPVLAFPGESVSMIIHIHWKNNKNADGDNIFKGIADALFQNDKCIFAGSFFSALSPEKKGRVDVKIILYTTDDLKVHNPLPDQIENSI